MSYKCSGGDLLWLHHDHEYQRWHSILTAEWYVLRARACIFASSMDGREASRSPSPKTGKPGLVTSLQILFYYSNNSPMCFGIWHQYAVWCSDQPQAGELESDAGSWEQDRVPMQGWWHVDLCSSSQVILSPLPFFWISRSTHSKASFRYFQLFFYIRR